MSRRDESRDPETRIRFFEEREFQTRLERTRAEPGRRRLDALLLFAPESLYYLTGYDSTGYVFFQCGGIMMGY
jgi:Xaa-Pro aminopeptidase